MVSSTTQKVYTHSTSPENISILLVSPNSEDLSALRRILHHGNWKISRASGLMEAADHLRNSASSVVICERDLPDGDWRDILKQTADMAAAPLLLVVSRNADESLWAEVLNLGGYDVLLKPFERSEVLRVISMAWRHWWSKVINQKPHLAATRVQFA